MSTLDSVIIARCAQESSTGIGLLNLIETEHELVQEIRRSKWSKWSESEEDACTDT